MNRFLFILYLLVLSFLADAQTTDFTFRSEGELYCAPVQVRFTQTSSGTPKGFLWDFGNGQRSNNPNPAVTYTSAGNYRVRLITVYENTTAEKIHIVSINRPVSSSFTPNRDRLCQPGEVIFNARGSSNIVRNEWDFGDGSQLISETTGNTAHTYSGFGSFTATLTSFNEAGCFSRYSQTINISRPVLSGTRTPESGCAPVNAQFNTTLQLPPGSHASQFNWNFGDGITVSNTRPQMGHNYTLPGIYVPSVSVQTLDGCTATYTFDSIRFGSPPRNHVAYTQTPVICASEAARFVSHADGATEYAWDFGNGNPVITRDTFIDKKFSQLGIRHVTVTPLYHKCPGTPLTLQVEIIGVIAEYTFRNTCSSRETFDFRNSSQGHITSYLWNVGDQRTPYYTYNLSRRFPRNGSFPVILTIMDSVSGCVDSTAKRLYTADPRLITPSESICINTNAFFRVDRTYSNPAATYLWTIFNQSYSSGNVPNLTIPAETHGIFDSNRVVIQNGPSYCPDTVWLNHAVKVKGPLLHFTMPDNICLDTKLIVQNQSGPYFPGDSIRTWEWHMGTAGSYDNQYQPQPVQYTTDRAYDIRLSASDINGCRDTLIQRVNVRPMPFLWTIPRIDSICQGQASPFIAYTSDHLSWTSASPVSGLCNTCDTLSLRPVQSSVINVTSTNNYQCAVSDSIQIFVSLPFTARAAITDTAICMNEKLVLHVEPRNLIISWSPADKVSTPDRYDPEVSPRQSTIFRALLTDSIGCFSSEASIDVTVKSLPEVNIGPDQFKPYFGQFVLQPRYSNNARYYTWSPADSLSCEHCPNTSGIAVTSKRYSVTTVSDSGCVAKDDIMVYVDCRNAHILLPKAFTPNHDRLNDLYRPITRGISLIRRFSIYNREGQLLYDARNFIPNKNTQGWDGQFRGTTQPGGAYVYLLDAICETGQDINSKGSFLLIR